MARLRVNGRDREVAASDETPLLWVLRDELGLKGTKFGCGSARCGACSILLDGVAVRSCVTPGLAADWAEITTIEGLSETGDHPLQKAWIEVQAPQCGYCQSGQIMQAASLLARTPAPSEQQIVDAMRGNLCRCMAYTRIKKAIQAAANTGGGAADNG